jgi:hypothetical protein
MRITEETLMLDGTEHKWTFWNASQNTTACLLNEGDKLVIESKVTFT